MKNGPDRGPVLLIALFVFLALAIELAFFRDSLERLAGALDPILMLIAFRRQKFHDLEGPARTKTAKRAGRVADILTDRIFVNLQHSSLPVTPTQHPATALAFP